MQPSCFTYIFFKNSLWIITVLAPGLRRHNRLLDFVPFVKERPGYEIVNFTNSWVNALRDGDSRLNFECLSFYPSVRHIHPLRHLSYFSYTILLHPKVTLYQFKTKPNAELVQCAFWCMFYYTTIYFCKYFGYKARAYTKQHAANPILLCVLDHAEAYILYTPEYKTPLE